MQYKKKLFANLKKLKKYGSQSNAADYYDTVQRECADLLAGNRNFSEFCKTADFRLLCEKLSALIQNGLLPNEKELIRRFDGFLTVKQAENFRNTIRFYLTECIARACDKKDDEQIGHAIRSFFILKDIGFPAVTSALCKTDLIFSSEKAGIYPDMAEETKAHYLRVADLQAQKEKIPTESYAERMVYEADKNRIHVGFLLPLGRSRKKEGISLILAVWFLSLFSAIAVGILTESVAAGVLCILPLCELFFHLMRMTAALRRSPAHICRMDRNIACRKTKTAIVVSSVLPKAGDIKKTERHLQMLYLANRDCASAVCLLADLHPGQSREESGDKTDIDAAKQMIDRLNTKLSGRFILALRERTYSNTQHEYIGRERKRGAVLSLAKYICNGENDFMILHGEENVLADCEYMMLLDADTQMPFDSLKQAVAAAAHPLNRPTTDDRTDTVIKGYGILAPNAAPSVKSFSASRFSRDMCKSGGISAYDRKSNDFYGDFFANGIFCGKGLVHVKTFYQTMHGRFREETMLSHDIAEGLILRVLPLTDMTLTDDFPKTETAYYKRENRWIRGDIQNLPLLGNRIFAFGEKVRSPLQFEEKYKLFDNIRRALTPIAALTGILFSCFMRPVPAAAVLVIVLLSRSAGDLLHGFSALFKGGLRALSGKYKEDALPEALSSFVRAFLCISQTSTAGFNALDAVMRSLWRMLITKKHLLSWTTAAAADKKSGFSAVFIPHIPTLIVAALLLASARPLCIAVGVMFVFDLFYAYRSQKPISGKKSTLSDKNREYIIRECSEMWQYFSDSFREEYRYLPPDNISISPLPDTAKRTSPTNIGLALCVYLTARDLEFIDSSTLYNMLDKTVSTVEKLDKWQGNLLNWYDIKTAKPLPPVFSSFVDSGNFICCITALKEGLYEYISEEPRLADIAARLGKLIAECRLSAFYNDNRRLFSISYDLESNRFSDSYYDLLMSEARMASYAAVANGQVPSTHWSALAGTTAKCGKYAGALSWSGTMFEYFMPYIFLPAGKNTLTDESLWFCVKSQMRYAAKNKIPWGISESCFYAFNRDLSYSYKANGVPDTALKRFYEKDLIVSPYSSFLTLPFIPNESVDNLKRLEKYPSKGIYGFFEALDFTPGRASRKNPASVQCFMVHHLGMSLLSCANALDNRVWQKRFMRNLNCAAASGLLEEQIPPASAYYKPPAKEPADREKEQRHGKKEEEQSAAVYCGENLTLALHESGCMALHCGSISLTRQVASVTGAPQGIFAAVKTKDGVLPFTKEPNENENGNYKCRFGNREAAYSNSTNSLKITQILTLDRKQSCIRIQYKIKNLSAHPTDGILGVYFEPSLTSKREETAHRTYAKLFIKSCQRKKNGCILFERSTQTEQYALAAGFSDADFSFTTDKDGILPIDGSVRALFCENVELNGRSGSVDCCFYAETAFRAGAKKELTFHFYLTAAPNGTQAENIFSAMLNGGFTPKTACKLFAEDPQKQAITASLLGDLAFPDAPYAQRNRFVRQNHDGIDRLWSAGISGDDSMILFYEDGSDMTAIRNFAAVGARLNACGIRHEMIILHGENIGYESNRHGELLHAISKDHTLSGVTILNTKNLSEGTENLLCALAAAIYPEDGQRLLPQITQLHTALGYRPDGVTGGDTADGYCIPTHPPVPWSRTLCNRSFGCLVTDRGLGFTWSMNSAENKLTPWTNDPYSDISGEILSICTDEKHYDILAGAVAYLGEYRAKWQSHAAGCIFTTVVSVPEKGMCKKIRVSVKNTTETDFQGNLCYTVNPVMGRDLSYAKTIKKKKVERGVLLKNPYNRDYDGFLLITGQHAEAVQGLTFRKNAALSQGLTLCIPLKIAPGEEYTAEYAMSYGLTAKAAAILQKLKLPEGRQHPAVIRSGNEKTDELVNRYLIHQVERTRIFARCAFYQCGGAYGFRDQLQDCLNLVKIRPELLKVQLFRSAASQFPQGDVLHWWHVLLPNGRQTKRGIRTRCSDDLVWLPYAAAEYVAVTNDKKILQTPIPFSDGALLKENEKDLYFFPKQTAEKADLYEHCIRALDKAYTLGRHGLLLIGDGDWNDSFNTVGSEGKGESVWLTMFYILTLKKFLPLCRLRSDDERYGKYEQIISELTDNIEKHAWDGDRYLRAFYDDGTPMGAKDSESCTLDLLPQSFASLAGLPDKQRIKIALKTAWEQLFDSKSGIVKLFTPPFTEKSKKTGYVNFYPPGVRENGGQYTHAAIWFIKALYKEGFRKEAEELIDCINPLNRLEANGLTGIYRNEPYALSGDVYSLKNYEGRGGWSLYTGAAGWLLSTAMEIYGEP